MISPKQNKILRETRTPTSHTESVLIFLKNRATPFSEGIPSGVPAVRKAADAIRRGSWWTRLGSSVLNDTPLQSSVSPLFTRGDIGFTLKVWSNSRATTSTWTICCPFRSGEIGAAIEFVERLSNSANHYSEEREVEFLLLAASLEWLRLYFIETGAKKGVAASAAIDVAFAEDDELKEKFKEFFS